MSKGIEFEVELKDKDFTLADYIDIYAIMPIKQALKTHPFLWVYAKADQMKNHKFTDDVCICYALTKRQAYKKFSELYASIDMNDIKRVYFWNKGTAILTDY